MEDCRSTAHKGVIHGLSVLDSVSEWIGSQQTQRRLWDAGKPFEHRAAELKADLTFICDELAKMEGGISGLKHTLYEHQALTHDRRNFTLTLLAAVFLPLSFTSTFFGMNINTMTSSGPKGFSNWTTSWINNSPADIQNPTRALASTIGSSGTLTYSWTTYTITATCLVLTLPLSLTIGSILRTAYRSTAYYATYWRVFAVFPSFVFIFFSIFGLYFFFPVTMLYISCNGLLCLYLFSRLFLAWRSRQRRRFWTFLSVITPLSAGLDWATGPFPMMLLPWLCFVFTCLWPWWRRRKQEKAREQDATRNQLEMAPISASHVNQTGSMNNTDDIHPS